MCVENLTVADIGYPLITRRVMSVFQQQLVHVHNGCISDDPIQLPICPGRYNQLSLDRKSLSTLSITKRGQ